MLLPAVAAAAACACRAISNGFCRRRAALLLGSMSPLRVLGCLRVLSFLDHYTVPGFSACRYMARRLGSIPNADTAPAASASGLHNRGFAC